VKRVEGGETIGGATGTVRVQRSTLTGLEPVRKGKADCRGRVETFDGGVSEDGKPVRANEKGDPKQRVRQSRRGKKVDRYRRQFVGESEDARDVGGLSHGQRGPIWEIELERGKKRLGREEW
jgi:hypothetical protein